MSHRYGDITLFVLDTLKDVTCTSADLFVAMISAGYGASPGKIDYHLRKLRSARSRARLDELAEERVRNRYHSFLQRLRRDGLVQADPKSNKKRGARLVLTKKGLQKLLLLRERRTHIFPTTSYDVAPSHTLVLVIFDIPEKERRKRDWLRQQLFSLGFKMIQKSVWIGKVKVPKSFIEDLRDLHILPFVEIFEITKSGSLENLTD